MSALLQTPRGELEPDGGRADHRLVAAVRRGDDRAFEALYQRYHRRIHAYVFGMVKDHQRAEDVTQEVFVSALRRMRATERPIAFKPWVYEIAKNACIDQFRRAKRAEEVSYNADDGLAPSDYGRLVSHRAGARRRRWTAKRAARQPVRRVRWPLRTPTTRSSCCASSRASPTARSASAWA